MDRNTIVLLSGLAMVLLSCGCNDASPPCDDMMIPCGHSDWPNAGQHGKLLTTDHYRIYTTAGNRLTLEYLPGFMEAAHKNYLRATGLADKPVAEPSVIYMMGTRQEWADLTRSVVGAGTPALGIESGGYCYNKVCVFWDMGGLGTLGTASHEGLHQFLAWRMHDHLPMWLEEGLCTTVEGYSIEGGCVTFTPRTNVMRFGDLKRAIFGDYWIPLAKLLPLQAGDMVTQSTDRAVGYYGQLWALALFIKGTPQYRAGFERIMRDAQGGRFAAELGIDASTMLALSRNGIAYNRAMSEKVFRHYISDDMEGFERQYRAFAEKLVNIK